MSFECTRSSCTRSSCTRWWEVQYEYEGEESISNPGIGIGWFPNTNFDGVDTQTLFDDNFFHLVPDNRVVNIPQKLTLDWKLQKLSECIHQILEVNIYKDDTEYYFQVYNLLWSIQRKVVARYFKSNCIDFLSFILVSSLIKCSDLPSQFFSEDKIIGHEGIRFIMSVSNILRIMMYFHTCNMRKHISR